jgi:hypothetical protein
MAGRMATPLDTPARLQALEKMPALKMTARSKNGQVMFTYADPYDCKCLYVGGQQEYDRYKALALKQEVARENLEGSMVWADSGMDWDMWGPWEVARHGLCLADIPPSR